MTAIACRAGTIAADSVGWTGQHSHLMVPVAPKIRPASNLRGGLAACVGSTAEIDKFWTWFGSDTSNKPEPFNKEDDFSALWLKPDGTIWVCGWDLHFFRILSEFYAEGACKVFMFGALHAGASAEEAVRLAVLYTDGAGGEVQVERLHPKLAEVAD